MDERMMNLFTLIAEQAKDRNDLFDREDIIIQSLLNSGCRLEEADAALTIMQSLSLDGPNAAGLEDCPVCVRTMTRQERVRFSPEAFGFLSKLVRLGVLSEDQREDIIERAMAAYPGRIELEQIKTLVALSISAGDHDVYSGRTAQWN